MFEVGKEYRITTGEGADRSQAVYSVIEVSMPLIKVKAGGGSKILNTHARSFIEAEPLTHNPETEYKFAGTVKGFTDRSDEDDQSDFEDGDTVWDTSRLPPTGY
jgi:hypothetical protein